MEAPGPLVVLVVAPALPPPLTRCVSASQQARERNKTKQTRAGFLLCNPVLSKSGAERPPPAACEKAGTYRGDPRVGAPEAALGCAAPRTPHSARIRTMVRVPAPGVVLR